MRMQLNFAWHLLNNLFVVASPTARSLAVWIARITDVTRNGDPDAIR
jgi:hypothetical protein